MQLDNIDRKILDVLQDDGRLTNRDLAVMVNLSPPTTLERVKKLESKGYIKRFVAIVDPAKVNTNCFTYVEVTLARHGKDALLRFTEEITDLKEVLECHRITGGADFLLKVATQNISGYEDFLIHKLTDIQDIQHLKTLVVLSTLKQETKIPINKT
ncbi:MAG: Lrp/AsnC family transcriptional regulator [Gammaproteobacteria bacterium]|nr:Lrp/AsnC family transcriptional regulator [Gammaproteobacteria bacterium]